MEAVQGFIHALLQTSRYGGRVVIRDEKTLIVFDTPSWSEQESRALRAKFPECDVAVQAFDGSMSGFIVIVTKEAEPWGMFSEITIVLVSLGVLWTAWSLLNYLSGRAGASD